MARARAVRRSRSGCSSVGSRTSGRHGGRSSTSRRLALRRIGRPRSVQSTSSGRRPATPLGPAAGPHSQLAENIVLAWLGGARIVELKTVQVLDELDISRPCIDMETVGYNVEWSQELAIGQSLEEYVKAWMIIEILREWDELRPFVGPDPGPHVFDVSVGYDLAGIASAPVAAFIDGLTSTAETIERLRAEIPEPFAAWRDHPFPTRIAASATLSTFHGCPPDEISSISKHLMTRHGLDLVVKLNPTLLGSDRVRQDRGAELGYDEVQLRQSRLRRGSSVPRGARAIGDLDAFARTVGDDLIAHQHARRRKPPRGPSPVPRMYLSDLPSTSWQTSLLDEPNRGAARRLGVEGQAGTIAVSCGGGSRRRTSRRWPG